MPLHPQTPLALDVHSPFARRGLATIEWVRRHTGFDAETIWRWIDFGELVWVWDVTAMPRTHAALRELRFWPVEVLARGTPALGELQQRRAAAVIAEVLGAGNRERIGATELAQLLLVSRPHVMRLVRRGLLTGVLTGGKQWVSRASAEKFLSSRLIEPELKTNL